MAQFIIPRIKEIVEAREQKIENYVQKAQTINKQALETLERYEKAIELAKKQADAQIAEEREILEKRLEQKKNQMDAALSKKMAENEQILAKDRAETIGAIDQISEQTAQIILQKLGFEKQKTAKKDS